LYRAVRRPLAGVFVRIPDDRGTLLQRALPDARLRDHGVDPRPVRRLPGAPLACPRGGHIARIPQRGFDALHFLVHTERAEDFSGALQVGARFVRAAADLAEQPVGLIDARLVDRRALERAAQRDRLLEEHEPGLVALPAAEGAQQRVDPNEAARLVGRDRELFGSTHFFLRLEPATALEQQLREMEPDRHVEAGIVLVAAYPGERLAECPRGGPGPPQRRVELAQIGRASCRE